MTISDHLGSKEFFSCLLHLGSLSLFFTQFVLKGIPDGADKLTSSIKSVKGITQYVKVNL